MIYLQRFVDLMMDFIGSLPSVVVFIFSPIFCVVGAFCSLIAFLIGFFADWIACIKKEREK